METDRVEESKESKRPLKRVTSSYDKRSQTTLSKSPSKVKMKSTSK